MNGISQIVSTVLGSVVKYATAAVGTVLVSKGYLTTDNAATLVTELSGAVLIIIAGIMSHIGNKTTPSPLPKT